MSDKEKGGDRLFFPEQRQQRLDLMMHLIPNSSQAILLRGPKECGKTFFVQQFKAQADVNWLICIIEAGQLVASDSPITVCAQAFDQLDGSEKQVILRLTSWSKANKKVILCVEDAHQLNKEQFDFLFGLAQEFTCLHLLFTSSENLGSGLEAQCLLIDLSPFTQKQTIDYAKNYTKGAGLDLNRVAGIDEVILFIETGGLPGRINDVLLQSQQAPKGATGKPKKNNATMIKVLVFGLIMLGIVSYFLLLPETKQPSKQEMAHIIDLPRRGVSTEKALIGLDPSQGQSLNDAKPSVSPKVVDDEPVTNKNEQQKIISEDSKNQTKTTPITTAKVEAPVVQNTVISSVSKVEGKVVEQQVSLPVKEPVKPVVEAKQLQSSLRRNHAWIKQKNGRHYALQLIAVSSEQSAQAFIARHKKVKNLYYFKNKRNNGDWYSVIYGDFASKKNALEATKNMPLSLTKVKPWVRTFESISKELFDIN
ncbi:MAG: SPOR domain-containing protein [Cycloclasticus sp.]|nr:SPOR domain-containing protein [Cycloclasticus sp.]MBQ0789848.1 SPOR domain-containing protein [Cycloclasticus sp.]